MANYLSSIAILVSCISLGYTIYISYKNDVMKRTLEKHEVMLQVEKIRIDVENVARLLSEALHGFEERGYEEGVQNVRKMIKKIKNNSEEYETIYNDIAQLESTDSETLHSLKHKVEVQKVRVESWKKSMERSSGNKSFYGNSD